MSRLQPVLVTNKSLNRLCPIEFRNESSMQLPVLNTDSEAIVDIGIANTSLAIKDVTDTLYDSISSNPRYQISHYGHLHMDMPNTYPSHSLFLELFAAVSFSCFLNKDFTLF